MPDSLLFCTTATVSYLPLVLALHDSILAQHPESRLVVLLIDGAPPESIRDGLDVVLPEEIGLDEQALHDLAAIYDAVELSTALKPFLMRFLLAEGTTVVHLDADAYVVSPLDELREPSRSGVMLTPHLLQPMRPCAPEEAENETLVVGVFNLGFCAATERGRPFLDWWWGHLERECLANPMLGMFLDQKWVDLGAVLFDADVLRHPGYNIGPWNAHERHIVTSGGQLVIERESDPVRFIHFSGFDPAHPHAASRKQSADLPAPGGPPEWFALRERYAQVVLAARAELGTPASYGFARDTGGRVMPRRLKAAYRHALLAGERPPSPFRESDRAAWARWRRRSIGARTRVTVSNATLALKYPMPDLLSTVQRRVPGLFRRLRRTVRVSL